MLKGLPKSRFILLSSASVIALAFAAVPVTMDMDHGFPAVKVANAESGSSCFVGGTKVLMADGSQKDIEDVVVGNRVRGYDGAINTVTGIECPKLGNRKLYSINGGKYFVTAEHPFMTPTGWKSIDPTATKAENAELLVEPLRMGESLIATRVRAAVAQPVIGNLALATDDWLVTEYVQITRLEASLADPDLQLYNLLLDGNHTYHADGYVVHNKGGGGGGSGDGGSGGGSGSGGSGPGSEGSASGSSDSGNSGPGSASGNSGHGSANSGHGSANSGHGSANSGPGSATSGHGIASGGHDGR